MLEAGAGAGAGVGVGVGVGVGPEAVGWAPTTAWGVGRWPATLV